MLVIKVELWPHGDAEQAEALGVVAIVNSGPAAEIGPLDLRRYSVELQDHKVRNNPIRGEVNHFRRHGWRVLVRKALQEVL